MLFSLWWTAMFLSSWVTIITWNVLNAILLGGLCELIACSMCNLFFSFLVLAEITMVVMKPMRIIVIAVKGVGAWFYSQPLLQTVCFTKELYRVSLRLNMIYTNLHIWVFFVFYLMVSIVLVRVNAKEQFCWPTYFLIWLELSSTQVPPLPLLPVKLTLQFFGSFFEFRLTDLVQIISLWASLQNSMAHLSWRNLNCMIYSA